MSLRLLVFLDGQVYYRCEYSHYSEVSNWPGKPLYDQHAAIGFLYSSILLDSITNSEDFSIILNYYTLRKLSFQSDILRAAQGMLRKFSILSGLHCFEGLPSPLDQSLLFEVSTHSLRRGHGFGRREGFPTYSWTGWKSVSTYDYYLDTRASISNDKYIESKPGESTLRNWIIWHARLEDGKLSRISDTGRLRKTLLLKPEDSNVKSGSNFRKSLYRSATSTSDPEWSALALTHYFFSGPSALIFDLRNCPKNKEARLVLSITKPWISMANLAVWSRWTHLCLRS